MRLIAGSASAISAFKQNGFKIIVVTNQPVIARGLATESDVESIHAGLQEKLIQAGGQPVHAFYVCPHHPNANLPKYRLACDCRKPKPGLLIQAASDWEIDLQQSWMVGDRPSDILAGRLAGCHTILLESGRHLDPPIESTEDLTNIRADYTCKSMAAVLETILKETKK